MPKYLNPETVAPPIGRYTHAVEVAPGARTLHISGQVGIGRDGKLAQGFTGQCTQIWRNIEAILAAADMKLTDLVRVTTFIINPADLGHSRSVRQDFLGDHRPASSLLVVNGLAGPEYLLEIEAVAAKETKPGPAPTAKSMSRPRITPPKSKRWR